MGRHATRSCTTEAGCVHTATYEIRAHGGFVGSARKPPPAVHLLACESHLDAARHRIRDREYRSIQILTETQASLFDGLADTEGKTP
jgi:hypothetical protein